MTGCLSGGEDALFTDSGRRTPASSLRVMERRRQGVRGSIYASYDELQHLWQVNEETA